MSQLFKTGIAVSNGNSTNIPLAADGYFIGMTDDVTSYEEIDISIAGEPSNAYGSLYFEFSPDGIHWDVSIWLGEQDITIQNHPPQHLRVILPYFRIKYYNGSIPQTEFRLTTVYHRVSGTRITRYLNQIIDNTEGSEITRSIIDGYRISDGTYVNIKASDNNHLIVDGYITNGNSYVDITSSNALKVDNSAEQVKVEYDLSSTTVNYIGTAPSGTATSAAAWTIKKITFDGSGNPTEILWSSSTAIWDNRVSEAYS